MGPESVHDVHHVMTGFVSEFVSDLWSLLEEGDDYHLVLSCSGPLDPSNRTAHKVMV